MLTIKNSLAFVANYFAPFENHGVLAAMENTSLNPSFTLSTFQSGWDLKSGQILIMMMNDELFL